MKNKAVRYRIYPNTKQIVLLANFFGCVRKVYNLFLDIQNKRYKNNKKYMSKNDMNDFCNNVLKSKYPYLKIPDKFALTNSIYNLDAAFKNFFEGRSKYPNFKSKSKSRRSYTTNATNNNIEILDGYVKLPKLGKVKASIHRKANDGWEIKSATVSQTPSGEYYVSILYAYEDEIKPVDVDMGKLLGLDFSAPYLYIDSDGNEPDYEKPFRKYQEKLAREQQKLSKMREDAKKQKRDLSECKNYQKQKIKVAKIYRKITNCRKDALHKISLRLAESYDAVVIEDIDMHAMAQCLDLGKSVLDNGWGMFTTFLKYKLEDRGKQLVVIDRWYPSTKTCHRCGNVKPVRLNERTYVCPECGLELDRDWNAAINIREEGKRLLSAKADAA